MKTIRFSQRNLLGSLMNDDLHLNADFNKVMYYCETTMIITIEFKRSILTSIHMKRH